MIVNGKTTKCMVFGKIKDVELVYNGAHIEIVDAYKYLGNMFNTVSRVDSDIFRENTEYLISQARKAIFSIKQKLHNIGDAPPQIKLHLFQSMVQPILLYGSDIWGQNHKTTHSLDKVLLEYLRGILKVKKTTSSYITIGEFGIIPPSILAEINVILFCIRVQSMSDDKIVKKVFLILKTLHTCGFQTWYSKVCELAQKYDINLETLRHCEDTKQLVKKQIKSAYVDQWYLEIANTDKNPILSFYKKIKENFNIEAFLKLPIKEKYRNAISKIRASSHILAIERGRYTTPKTPRLERKCAFCGVVEDEIHFILTCALYKDERDIFFRRITEKYSFFVRLNENDKITYLFKSNDPQILSWLGRFINSCFTKRSAIVPCA